jgi:phage-related protein
VAPLLAQIRTEFAPAVGELVTKLSGQGGLGPALISAATALVQLMAGLDLSGLTAFMEAIAALANAVTWISQNVPGANFLISMLLMSMLGFKLLGPVFSMIGGGAKAFSWLTGALQGTKNLTKAQQMFKGVAWMVAPAISKIGMAFKTLSMIGIGALRALSVALVTTPIGWVILAIMAVVAVIYLLWTKCEWFRDAVTAVWEWIQKAAVVAWEWIKKAFWITIIAINQAAQAVADFVVGVWRWISDTATTIWTAISDAFKATMDFIASVAMWLYTNVIEPVFSAIATVVGVYFDVVKFVVQTAIFFIVAIISLIALAAKAVWDDVSSRAQWTFDRIGEIVGFFRDIFVIVVNFIVTKWNEFTTAMGLAWQVFYTTYIKPIIDGFSAAWVVATSYISNKWNEFTTVMGIAWRLFYDTYIGPIIDGFQNRWSEFTGFLAEVWGSIVAGFQERWNFFKDVVGGVISTISDAWGSFTQFLSDTFSPVGDALTYVWQKIQDGATTAAKIVAGAWDGLVGIIKGVWNAIARGWNGVPAITVPDIVPVIGGQTFSLPKLPMLWHGGEAPGGKAVVGEHGQEPVIRNGQFIGMVGTNGPEIADIPRGGYVVPNLNTLAALPGLTKSLPAGVAAAVARSVPGYAGALKAPSGRGDTGLRRSVDALTSAVAGQMPPVHLHGTSDELLAKVVAAWKAFDSERRARGRYSYTAGKG